MHETYGRFDKYGFFLFFLLQINRAERKKKIDLNNFV